MLRGMRQTLIAKLASEFEDMTDAETAKTMRDGFLSELKEMAGDSEES